MMRDQPTGGHIFNMDGAGGCSHLPACTAKACNRPGQHASCYACRA